MKKFTHNQMPIQRGAVCCCVSTVYRWHPSMIVRRSSWQFWIIFLCIIACVVIDVRLPSPQPQQQLRWNVEAWKMIHPISGQQHGRVTTPLRKWGFIQRGRDLQQHHWSVLLSMKLPHEMNLPQDAQNIDINSGTTTERTSATTTHNGMHLNRTNANFQVRDCTHGELNFVADIIMDSFYNYTDSGSIWKQLTKLAELNRIQQNFPYGPDKAHHRMMVVTTTETNPSSWDMPSTICGFVDIDTRIPNRPTSYRYNPRPYLSDLCIHPDYRRYGLATLLIESCEDYCRSHHRSNRNGKNTISSTSCQPPNALSSIEDQLGPELYIRVETKNTIAIQMYEKLGYSILSDHADSSNANILILYKAL